MRVNVLIFFISLVFLVGCVNLNRFEDTKKQTVASLSDHQSIELNTEVTVIGVARKGLIGHIILKEMSKLDRIKLNDIYERGPAGVTQAWVDSNNGNHYEITPGVAYNQLIRPRRCYYPGYPETEAGSEEREQLCRRAKFYVLLNDGAECVCSTACRKNGQWQLQ